VTDSGDTEGLSLGNGLAGLDFRLHKKTAALKELYDSNALAIIHAAGLTNGHAQPLRCDGPYRAGFAAKQNLERGVAHPLF